MVTPIRRLLFGRRTTPMRRQPRAGLGARPGFRPSLESLEVRCLPAILIVNPAVPADYQNIKAAVNAATGGDTIQVVPGTYGGSNNLGLTLNKAITIESTDGAATTIIDCSTDNFVFVNSACTIRGFTFENSRSGDASPLFLQTDATITGCAFKNNTNFGGNGGGIELNGGTATISNCTFDHQSGSGAISSSGGSANISNCSFTNGNGQSGGGGGAINLNTGNVTITGCTFSHNTGGSQAGGVFYWRNGALTISQSTFTDNSTSYGGVVLAGTQGINSPVSFSQCTFSGNTASISGGVAALEAGSSGLTSVTATNCLFLNNTAANDGAVVDGNTAGASPNRVNIVNSSFFGNQVTGSGQTGVISGGATTTVQITNSILFGDLTPKEISTLHPSNAITIDHSDIKGGFAGTGNINADPLYVDPAGGNLQTLPISPVINAGTSGAKYRPPISTASPATTHPTWAPLNIK